MVSTRNDSVIHRKLSFNVIISKLKKKMNENKEVSIGNMGVYIKEQRKLKKDQDNKISTVFKCYKLKNL